MRTSSPRRNPDRPIASVALRISFQTDRNTAKRVMRLFPSALLESGVCQVELSAAEPGAVAEGLKKLLETVKRSASGPERI